MNQKGGLSQEAICSTSHCNLGLSFFFYFTPCLCWNRWNRSHRGSCRGLWMEWIMRRSPQTDGSKLSCRNHSLRNAVRRMLQTLTPAQWGSWYFQNPGLLTIPVAQGLQWQNESASSSRRVARSGWRNLVQGISSPDSLLQDFIRLWCKRQH